MRDLGRRILTGLLVLIGAGPVGCSKNPLGPCLSIAERPHPRGSDAGTPAAQPDAGEPPQPPMHPCLSAPMEPCLSVAPPRRAPAPDKANRLDVCLSIRPPEPIPGLPDASSDARVPADPRQVLAGLADRLPEDVKERLGISGDGKKKA